MLCYLCGAPMVKVRLQEGREDGMKVGVGEDMKELCSHSPAPFLPGYMAFSSPELQAQIEAKGLAPLHWADDDGNPTEQYPLNPNGSPGGVAGVCSPDGRHLALMPHPERAVRPWQWAWRPPPFDTLTTSPWLQLFINARNWTQEGGC